MSRSSEFGVKNNFNEGNSVYLVFDRFLHNIRAKKSPRKTKYNPANEKAYLAADLVADAILNLARKDNVLRMSKNRFPLERTGAGLVSGSHDIRGRV